MNLSFEPPPFRKSATLQSQLAQIISQKGAFRHISEQSLAEEANDPTRSVKLDEQVPKDDVDSETEETGEVRLKRLWESRNEMLQRLDYAQNEILSALDFVSLLLSTHSEAAKVSMSPALTAAVPVGSLDMRKVASKEPSEATKTRLNAVSQSWRAQKFEASSSKLVESSNRLNKEAALQSKFWEQISRLKARGWPISRLPDDSRAIVVHFGFAEAAQQYRNRGFALLQQDEAGDLQISPISVREQKFIRVSIVREGVETGRSIERLNTKSDVGRIEQSLENARDALFDDELFYEIGREARLIANQGANLRSDAIEVDIALNYRLKISQTKEASQSKTFSDTEDSILADFIASNLRLLLVNEHESTYGRRSSQKPQPLSQAPRPAPEYAILRPIIAQLRHHAHVSEFLTLIKSYHDTFQSAGYSISARPQQSDKTNATEDKVNELKRPVQSQIGVILPSGKEMKFQVETYLASPTYGTQFVFEPLEYDFATLETAPVQKLVDLKTHVQQGLTLDVVESVMRTKVEDGRWNTLRPLSGELVLFKSGAKSVKVKITVKDTAIGVTVLRRGGTAEEIWEWSKDGTWQSSRKGQRTKMNQNLPRVISELSTTAI